MVVSVVLDQMGSWVFERYLPHLPEEGALRKIAATGTYYQRFFRLFGQRKEAIRIYTMFAARNIRS